MTMPIGESVFNGVVAGAMLAAGAPVFLAAAAAIKLDSPGPIFFRARRLGVRGQVIECLKFRSMKSDAKEKVSPDLKTVVGSADDRVTRVGRYLRWGFDELPQLINVLKGEMSIVGPRPDAEWMWPRYSEALKERLSIRPGVTGLGVVLDSRSITTEEGYRLDIWYVRHRNALIDAAILAATPFYVLGVRGFAKSLRDRVLAAYDPGPLLRDPGAPT
jgi:lipopolysaccharide/colanic/teichoic acid biosynthesis glycosyltransferase